MSAAPKKKAAPKKPAAHPMYKDMIASAISELKNKGGSSKLAISKYIVSNYNGSLRELGQKNDFACSGSFKLAKPGVAPKKAAPKTEEARHPPRKGTPPREGTPKKKLHSPKKKVAPKKKAKVTPKKKAAPRRRSLAAKKVAKKAK
ncbi:uncharacterized protein LOC134814813 [Bolinopsis microptera]|uniref:uncharacterized protein LOC134814813 n=1 Tax=Bolinopsis microptera TaxID=2820187 RepID=UPI003079E4AC